MRILKFTAENIKKLRAVEITPDGSVVQITGPNGSGKSSVLDAIFMALAGAKAIPGQPVRKGEQSAKVSLDMGEIVVTRSFKPDGKSTLTVTAADGARYASPQAMLDALLGALAFDPLAFARSEPKQQMETLRGLVPLTVDADALDRANAVDYAARTDLNRTAGDLKVQADAIQVPDGLPAAFVDVAAMLQQMEAASGVNADIEKRRANREALARSVNTRLAELVVLERRVVEFRNAIAADQEKLATAPALPDPVDVSVLRTQITAGQETNRHLEARFTRKTLLDRRVTIVQQAEDLTDRMAARTAEKQAAIAAAPMPVEGLSFGEGEVLFGGVPFAQASSAEQLRVSVAIAMASNPKIRILRVKDGGLLDEDSLAVLQAMADANDFQVWMETAGTHRPGIVMQDGAVAE